MITAVHQNQDYSHVSKKNGSSWEVPESERDLVLLGRRIYQWSLEDADWQLGDIWLIKRPLGRESHLGDRLWLFCLLFMLFLMIFYMAEQLDIWSEDSQIVDVYKKRIIQIFSTKSIAYGQVFRISEIAKSSLPRPLIRIIEALLLAFPETLNIMSDRVTP